MNSQIKELLKIPQHEQRSPEWFAQRKEKLTSSDAATVIGTNPYSKYHELLFKKCGIEKPFVGNIATFHGQKYEDEAIEKYCRIMGKTNYNFGCISYTDVHTTNLEHSFLAGSPDGIVESKDNPNGEEPILLEVKCPFRRKIIDGYIPEYYVPQVQLNLFICDLKIADFIEYCPKTNKLNIVRIYKDTNWLNKYLPILKSFWNDVLHYRDVGIERHIKFKDPNIVKEKKAKKVKKEQVKKEDDEEEYVEKNCMIID